MPIYSLIIMINYPLSIDMYYVYLVLECALGTIEWLKAVISRDSGANTVAHKSCVRCI